MRPPAQLRGAPVPEGPALCGSPGCPGCTLGRALSAVLARRSPRCPAFFPSSSSSSSSSSLLLLLFLRPPSPPPSSILHLPSSLRSSLLLLSLPLPPFLLLPLLLFLPVSPPPLSPSSSSLSSDVSGRARYRPGSRHRSGLRARCHRPGGAAGTAWGRPCGRGAMRTARSRR